MKLKKLYIEDYKNLKDFKLDFENDNGFSIIVGNNGSGKSNILEAISGIFCEWYGKVKYIFPCDYSLSYDYDGRIITLKREGKEKFFFENEFLYDDSSCFWLPSSVIALYSGEDMRLWEHLYMPTYLQYFKDLISGQSGRMCMYYVNKYLWNISLFTMLLFASELTDIADFLKDEIGIKNVETDVHNILISFDFKNYNKNNNPLVKSFIDKINPDHKSEIGNTLESWKSIINDFGNSNDIFNLLMQSFMPKDYKIITNIEIIFNGNLTLGSLSEGEKKLILTKAVLEFVADENSLLLFDEPDANIHEARKFDLYNLLKKYDNRQTIITSHSPSLVKNAEPDELKYLENKNGKTEVITNDKLELIRKLASDQWNIVEADIFLNSTKYLVLFEGKSDVDFVKQAIKLLKVDNPTYNEINVDFLNFNGTGNAESFLKNIRVCNPNKKVIIFFDRDDAGKTAMANMSNQNKNSNNIKNYNAFISDDGITKCAFYPLTSEVSDGEFLLEDYFKESLISDIISGLIMTKKHPVKGLPSLSKQVKSILANKYLHYPKEDFEGFKVLLDKIYEMTKE
ncbi:AAA family ATPase [Treponema pectinovorum]|uniref:ATP-dependent nuclease n=1 Tax=Treponema pectinovorum TaxID=164 RepID=UPI003D91BB24